MTRSTIVQLSWIPRNDEEWSTDIKSNIREIRLTPAISVDRSLSGLRGHDLGNSVMLWADGIDGQIGKLSSIPGNYFCRGLDERKDKSWQSCIDGDEWKPKSDTLLDMYLYPKQNECPKISLLGNDMSVVLPSKIFFRELDYWLAGTDEDVVADRGSLDSPTTTFDDLEFSEECNSPCVQIRIENPEIGLKSILKPEQSGLTLKDTKSVRFSVLTKAQETALFGLPLRYDGAGNALLSSDALREPMDYSPTVKGVHDEVLPFEGGSNNGILGNGRKFQRLSRTETKKLQRQREHMMRLMSDWMYTKGLKRDTPERDLPQRYSSVYKAQSTSVVGWRELAMDTDELHFDKVYKGSNFYIATAANGSIYGWGSNQNGSLGINSRVKEVAGPVCIIGEASEFPRGVKREEFTSFHDISVGSRHAVVTLVTRGEKELLGWGCNRYGRLGTAVSVENVVSPTKLMLFVAQPLPKFAELGGNDENKRRLVENKKPLKRKGLLSCLGMCIEDQLINNLIDEFQESCAPVSLNLADTVYDSMMAVDTSRVEQVYCQDVFTLYLLDDGRIMAGGVIVESDLEIGNFPLRYIKCGRFKFKRILNTIGVANCVGLITTTDRVLIITVPYSMEHGDVIKPASVLLHNTYITAHATYLSLIDTSEWQVDQPEKGCKVPYNASHLIILS
eukprot:GHVH01004428.1.p1 GENE.GHVH01004428.1~~GHVH01004428.1.p1  ORF type:complete len:675 (+),score=67.62 GHVH01004428.1:125-2149(+)